jgi:predicted alpha/beta-hydrolase family hydrolase
MSLLRQTYRSAIQMFSADPTAAPAHVFIGGFGLGAKVASLVASERVHVTGLYALGYPLHAAGKPDKLDADQLYRIITPMLFIQGSKARNCDLDTLRRVLRRVGAPTALHVVEEADHLFKVAKKSGRTPEQISAECLAAMEAWFEKVVGA